MRTLKALLPIIIIAILAFYARQYFSMLPQPLAEAMQYLPVLMVLFVSIVAIYFNQLKILLSVFILSTLYFCIENNLIDSELKIALFATFTPILLFVTQLFKHQNIASVRSIPLYLIYLIVVLFALWINEHQPLWATNILMLQWLPIKYFDWSHIPQLALIIYVMSFIGFIVLFTKKQTNHNASLLAILLVSFIFLQQLAITTEILVVMIATMFLLLTVLLQESWHMAYIDELTQLPGRRALKEKLQSLVGIYTLAMVDIDFFKKFNDKYGHDTGDEVLRMIAVKLSHVSGGGTAYRYGGEEFTIVFGNKSKDQTLEHLENLRENIANNKFVVSRGAKNQKNLKKNTVKITVSIGVCDSIGISTTTETLKQADKALYKAKKKGRNCIS